jgi:predicted dinucleotide-binding enzyme
VRIGIIGTGKMGRALGLRWAEAGHPVLFGSRDLRKAKAIAASRPNSTQSGDFDAAAAFGEVVLYTVRTVLPSRLLREPQALSGKIVIDCRAKVFMFSRSRAKLEEAAKAVQGEAHPIAIGHARSARWACRHLAQ